MTQGCSLTLIEGGVILDQGKEARLEGFALLRNPFPRHTTGWELWRLGWMNEEWKLRRLGEG